MADLNFLAKGEGTPVVLLHGWGGSLNSLTGLQDIIVEHGGYRVFNLDLPGFGQSQLPEKVLTLDDYVEIIAGFIKKENLFKPVLVGHSFGGKLSAALAVTYPELVGGLVLIDASGINPHNSRRKSLFLIPAKVFGSVFSIPGLNLIKPAARSFFYKHLVRERDYLDSQNLRQTFLNIVNTHLDKVLGKIKTPTLLIWGEDDTLTPLWMGEKMAELIPDSRLEVVAGKKHILPKTSPEIVAKIILAYLNSAKK
jgi:pimeloyl-ACP methyl ester carboxylesterase